METEKSLDTPWPASLGSEQQGDLIPTRTIIRTALESLLYPPHVCHGINMPTLLHAHKSACAHIGGIFLGPQRKTLQIYIFHLKHLF